MIVIMVCILKHDTMLIVHILKHDSDNGLYTKACYNANSLNTKEL